jgi:predicted nuclease of predicted toxin-antitoxin system
VDAQLPPALARAIGSHGHEAVHVFDSGLWQADDDVIWQLAIDSDASIITKDEDFVMKHNRSNDNVAVIWLRCGNVSRRSLLDWFLPSLPGIVALVDAGETLIEIR